MVIWSGWGILVIVSLFIGIVAGTLLSLGLGFLIGEHGIVFMPVLGLACAALTNRLFVNMLNSGEEKQLVDPRTGEVFVQKRGDSFFFIPMGAFTYIFGILAIPALIVGFLAVFSGGADSSEPQWGKEAAPAGNHSGSDPENNSEAEQPGGETVSDSPPETRTETEPDVSSEPTEPQTPPLNEETPPAPGKPQMSEPEPSASTPEPAEPAESAEDLTQTRTWKANDAKTMEAKLVEVKGDTVVFQKDDGKTYNVPLSRLSKEDIELIKNAQ